MPETEMRVTEEEYGSHHELLLDGQSVSGLSVIDRTMRIGASPVHMGGIGGVWTDRAHRNKGYARQVLEHSNVWMEAHDYDCATLFGIPDFYPKFGYAVCLPDCRVEVRTRNAERAALTLTARPFTPEDLPALREIYAENNADLSGSMVRGDKTSFFRKGSDYEGKPEGFVFADSAGAIQAYAGRDKSEDHVTIFEVGARRPEYYGDIARWAADRAVELRVEHVTFCLPPDHLCAARLSLYGAKQTLRFARSGEGMGRLLNLSRFLEKTLPEWTRRASATQGLAPGTALRLETDIGGATLRWTGEAVSLEAAQPSATVRLPQWRLMQLAMGYYGAELAFSFPEVQAEGDLSLFRALFPRRLPYMWRADHF